ncbi:hypothetical protein GUJ93_ZPchr0006g44150 [Zizania palustris]|uniref:Uncharacterized protein n=1 Tax=Zizania palustris TaxID=103762 RepID=A0A8J5SLG2_ZIZPA|nr:hypothetical protein GUJ93_ZPchr0006g44150 [Zizania palustris]
MIHSSIPSVTPSIRSSSPARLASRLATTTSVPLAPATISHFTYCRRFYDGYRLWSNLLLLMHQCERF